MGRRFGGTSGTAFEPRVSTEVGDHSDHLVSPALLLGSWIAALAVPARPSSATGAVRYQDPTASPAKRS